MLAKENVLRSHEVQSIHEDHMQQIKIYGGRERVKFKRSVRGKR